MNSLLVHINDQLSPHANVHMAIFYNGAIEPTRFADWVKTQMKHKQNVNQVMKHLTKRMTPPPKAFWLPPCSLRTMLRLALRSLRLKLRCLLAFFFFSIEKHFLEPSCCKKRQKSPTKKLL